LNHSLRQAAGELGKRRAAINGFENASVGAIPCAVFPWAFAGFPERGIDNVGVGGIDQNVRSANILGLALGVGSAGGFVAAGENFLPVLATVGGAIDAALRVGAVGVSGHGGKNLVRIFGIHGEFGNLLAVTQAEMRPGFAGVSGFVDAIAHGEIRAVQSFAAADIDDIGIRRRDGDRTDGTGGLVVKDGLPSASVIVGLPHAAVADAHIEDIGLRWYAA